LTQLGPLGMQQIVGMICLRTRGAGAPSENEFDWESFCLSLLFVDSVVLQERIRLSRLGAVGFKKTGVVAFCSMKNCSRDVVQSC
jgi:hypothetical protein